MKLYRFILIIAAVSASWTLDAQIRTGVYGDLYDSETVAAFKSHVRELSSAMLEGRKAGSEGEKLAAEYIEGMFADCNIDILSPSGGELFGIKKENGDT
jgi:hypothetical protein